MIVQNNPTPWVIFALIAMVMFGILGVFVGLDPFGPGQDVRAEQARTQLAIDIHGTENAMDVVGTPQAIFAQQTADIARLTAMPVQQTATQIAGSWALESARTNATQTAIAEEALMEHLGAQATKTSIAERLYLSSLASNATATYIVQKQVGERATNVGGLAVIIIGTLTFCGWLVARTFIQAIAVRAREKTAHAQLLAEQRRLVSLRASIQAQKRVRGQQYPVPTSLMEKRRDGKDLPRVE
jgi:hypothetical protein